MKKTKFFLISIIFCLAAISFQEISAANYDPQEIKQLVAFLNLQSSEADKTNAQALGIEAKVTETNVSEWADKIVNKTENDKIVWIRISGLNRKIRFGGSFHIENFSQLKWITLEYVLMGDEVKVTNCPELGEFALSAPSLDDNEKDSYPTRRLEIANCPKLYELKVLTRITEFVLNGCNGLERVQFNYTNFPTIDFSE